MKDNNTYYPEDIEQLLLKKEFNDLLPDEKEFVLQHVDSKEEYKLIRTTLLAIKKEADNNQLVKPNPKIKDDLLMLLEKRRNRAGWFNLNGTWGMLFPADVSFFHKPGFQIASVAVLVGMSFFIVRVYITDSKQSDLAINSHEIDRELIDSINVEQKNKESFVDEDLETDNPIKVTGETKDQNQLTDSEVVASSNKEIVQTDKKTRNIAKSFAKSGAGKEGKNSNQLKGLYDDFSATSNEKEVNKTSDAMANEEVLKKSNDISLEEEADEVYFDAQPSSASAESDKVTALSTTVTNGSVAASAPREERMDAKFKNKGVELSRPLSEDEDLINLLHISL